MGYPVLVNNDPTNAARGLPDPLEATEAIMKQFLRRYGVRMAFCVMLAVTVFEFLSEYIAYRGEEVVARKIRAYMSDEHILQYRWPDWMPEYLQSSLFMFGRIEGFGLSNVDEDFADLLPELKSLANLKSIGLANTAITDDSLKQLAGLHTLVVLDLSETRTTLEGRSRLRRSLPNCAITPDP